MISRISQLTKNLTDEFGKVSEVAGASTAKDKAQDIGDIDINGTENETMGDESKNNDELNLPLEIQNKLKKFAKYEQKYPHLLEAYKTEKARGALVASFEKVLRENTPCSSIAEGDALAEYLNSLTVKNTMLNEELKRLSKNAANDSKVKDLENEIERLRDSLKEKSRGSVQLEDESSKITGAEQAGSENQAQETQITSLKKSLEITSEELSMVRMELEDTKKTYITKMNDLNGQIKTLREENQKLVKFSEESKLLVEMREKKLQETLDINASLEAVLQKQEQEISHLNDLVKEKDNNVNESTKFLDEESQASILRSTASTSTKKNKKKKKKNADPDSIKETEQLPYDDKDFEPKNFDQLKADYESCKNEHSKILSSKNSEIAAKTEEIESLRDMLQSVGDELVSAKELVKSLQDTTKSQMEELEILRRQHAAAVTTYEKEKTEKEKKLIEVLETNRQLDASLQDFKGKVEELELLVKNSNTNGEEYQSISEELKHRDVQIKELQESSSKLSVELERSKEEMKKILSDSLNLKNLNSSLGSDIESLQKERTKLIQQQRKYEQDLSECNKIKRNEASLTKELNITQSNLTQKEKTIAYLEKQVKDYDNLKTQLLDDITKLKSSNRELTVRFNSANDQLQRITREKKQIENDLIDLQKNNQGLVDENKGLVDKLSVLQDKFEGLQELKTTNSQEVEMIKKQCDEISVSHKEALRRAEQLDEELAECRALLQERTREAGIIRRLLLEKEESKDSKVLELTTKLKETMAEKEMIQAESDMIISRKQKELNDIQLRNHELEKLVNDWKVKNSYIATELEQLRNDKEAFERNQVSADSSSDVSDVIAKLSDALKVSEKKVREYENLNNVLKKLNDDLNSKYERLTKNYKLLSTQLKDKSTVVSSNASSPVSTRSNSIIAGMNESEDSSVSGSTADTNGNDKIPYLRNVLLGFLEHKEQRQQLLPVISLLLQLKKADEKRLLTALS